MSACVREFYIDCIQSQNSSFEAAEYGLRGSPRPTKSKHAQYATHPANKQAKEEVVCVGLNRRLEQSLKHVGMHYPAGR